MLPRAEWRDVKHPFFQRGRVRTFGLEGRVFFESVTRRNKNAWKKNTSQQFKNSHTKRKIASQVRLAGCRRTGHVTLDGSIQRPGRRRRQQQQQQAGATGVTRVHGAAPGWLHSYVGTLTPARPNPQPRLA